MYVLLVPASCKFQSILFYSLPKVHFEISAPNDPKSDIEKYKVKRGLYIFYRYLWVPNFNPFSLYACHFEFQAILREVHNIT